MVHHRLPTKTRLYRHSARRQSRSESTVRRTTAVSSDSWLGMVVDSIAEGVVVTDRDGTILLANSRARHWLETLEPPADREHLRDELRRLAAEPADKAQSHIWLSVLVLWAQVTALGDNGHHRRRVITLIDVTPYEQIKYYLSCMLYDMQNPLTCIRGYSALLKFRTREEQTQEQREFLDNIMLYSKIVHARARKASQLVYPQERGHWVQVALDKLLREEIEALRKVANGYGITLIFNRPDQLPLVQVRLDLIRTVLSELLGNMLKLTPRDGRIEIALHAEDDTVYLTVHNSEITLSKEELEMLFEQFPDLHSIVHHLDICWVENGLYFTKNILAMIGGTLSTSSQAGRGTTFTVALPAT